MINDISVIICAHTEKRWQDLNDAIASVQQQTLPPKEIIVVVDHNKDLFERVREHISGVLAIENTEPQGLSGARNSGIALAQGQIIAFLDDDAIAAPDWLLALTQGYTDAPQVMGTGGAVTPLWLQTRPSWFPEEFYWVVGCTYRGMPETDAPIRNPIGANMSLRREVFEKVGGFRNGIGRIGSWPVGCEETELCIRAKQHWSEGIFLYHSAAQVLHRVPQKRTTWGYFCSRCYAEGLSKAAITRYVGAKDSLAAERSYTQRILPKGVTDGIRAALFHGDAYGLARACAIIGGLMATAVGYLVGTIFYRKNAAAMYPTNQPIPELSLSAKVRS